ncbi:MAG: ABC transporter ATP-binding protein, partial [Treponema sp.]|nr:ABC transporter ATP-binding protein [Treponema sp.]
NLLLDIRERRDLSFLFIAHDLRVACHFCDRIGVMYRGELMEEAPAAELYRDGVHPYTRLLFSSAPGNESGAETVQIREEVKAPRSCAFADRCPLAEARCFAEHPAIKDIAGGHRVRCFRI